MVVLLSTVVSCGNPKIDGVAGSTWGADSSDIVEYHGLPTGFSIEKGLQVFVYADEQVGRFKSDLILLVDRKDGLIMGAYLFDNTICAGVVFIDIYKELYRLYGRADDVTRNSLECPSSRVRSKYDRAEWREGDRSAQLYFSDDRRIVLRYVTLDIQERWNRESERVF